MQEQAPIEWQDRTQIFMSFLTALQAGGVPKYDFISETPLDGKGTNAQNAADGAQQSTVVKPRRQSQRCFNCGSFLHGLKVGV